MIEAILGMDENRDGIADTSSAVETLPAYLQATPPEIETLRAGFEAARDDANDKLSTRDRDYYDGYKQLTPEVRETLRQRQQPPIYTNRIRPAVNGVLGVLELGRRDPRGMPRNPDDEQAADVCTKTLRYISDESKFNDTQIDVAENMFIEGTGAVLVEVIDDKIVPTLIRWEEFYADKYSRRADFKDARYMGIAKWVDAATLMATHREAFQAIGDPMNPKGGDGGKFDDRGDGIGWVERNRKRVLLVEEYRVVEGVWHRALYVAAGVLEYGPSPYVDDKGRPCNPIEAVSCYVDNDNARYGIVRDMVPLQDEVNASRSRSLHLMNSRQITVDPNSPAAVVDASELRREAAKADGVLPPGATINQTQDMTQANMVRNQEAKGEIERMGPTPAILGRQDGGNQSGRARLVSQQAGLTELARPLGRLHGWVLRVYEQMWERARQFWTDEMWIRVTDELRAPQFLKINEIVTDENGQPVIAGYQPIMGEDGQPQVDPMTGQIAAQPVPQRRNRLAELNMDIILDQDEDTATLQQEVWGELMQLVSNAGGLAAIYSPEFETALEMSPIADKPRLLERLKAKRDERDQNLVTQLQGQVAQLTEALQAKQQADAATVQSEAEERAAKTRKYDAEAEGKAIENELTVQAATGVATLPVS